jgi:hypothetical protein
MAARVVTLAFSGVDAVRVEVEVQFTGGEKAFMLVGLGDKAVAESRERVRAAFTGLGLALPAKRIIANLAPADLPKVGSHYDLPIALAVMAGMGIIPADALEGWAAVGELSLDGRIMPVAGALPAAVAAGGMGLGLICPEACGPELGVVQNILSRAADCMAHRRPDRNPQLACGLHPRAITSRKAAEPWSFNRSQRIGRCRRTEAPLPSNRASGSLLGT